MSPEEKFTIAITFVIINFKNRNVQKSSNNINKGSLTNFSSSIFN